ncbi:MAG: hypothetical protein K2K08_04190, partial [Paramuribaculum sp.]|nr:hypothetical protein [Paramuribaculum sp.]
SDSFKISRVKACLFTMLPIFVFSTICSMSLYGDSVLKIGSVSVFDFLDNVATNILLPIVSIGVCIYMGWFAPKGIMNDEISNYGAVSSHPAPSIRFIIRFVAPLLIAIVLISYFIH